MQSGLILGRLKDCWVWCCHTQMLLDWQQLLGQQLGLMLPGQQVRPGAHLLKVSSQRFFYHRAPSMVGFALPMNLNIIPESKAIKFYRFLQKKNIR